MIQAFRLLVSLVWLGFFVARAARRACGASCVRQMECEGTERIRLVPSGSLSYCRPAGEYGLGVAGPTNQ